MSPDARPLLALAAPRVKEPMSHAPDLTMPHAGDILGGRYVLAERIGAGGMGRVFRARDEVLRRDVAVKIFFADRTDEAESLRRMAEARALAALDHPSLVTLYDARLDTGDHVYLVMELIDGPSLQRRIERGALAPADVAGIVADLAAALAVVHEAGIVHRDIKPSNVLLRPVRGTDRGMEAVLADFGVAHLVDATRLTTPGTVIGTAAYLAPEQVRGEPPQPASDVYALGLLAIEALTRLHPFGGGSVQETLLARLARQPDVPASLGYAWRSLLSAMTAHDPAARPSATAVAEQAIELAAGRETVAVDTGPMTVVDDDAWIDLGLPAVAIAAGVSTERLSEPTVALPVTGDGRRCGVERLPSDAGRSARVPVAPTPLGMGRCRDGRGRGPRRASRGLLVHGLGQRPRQWQRSVSDAVARRRDLCSGALGDARRHPRRVGGRYRNRCLFRTGSGCPGLGRPDAGGPDPRRGRPLRARPRRAARIRLRTRSGTGGRPGGGCRRWTGIGPR